MKRSIVLLLVLLAGCATGLNNVQGNCEARTRTFPAMVDCLNANFEARGPMTRYMARANALAGQVRAGTKSDTTARAELAAVRYEIANQGARQFERRVEERREATPAEAPARLPPPPKTMECREVGYQVLCTEQ